MDLQLESLSPSPSPVVVNDTNQRVYRASLTPVVAGVGIIGFIFVLGSVFGRPADGRIVAVIAACFAGVLCLVGLLSYRGMCLTVSPKGITYQTLGYSLSVPWEGVSGPCMALYGGGTMEALALRQDTITLHHSRHFGLGMAPLAKSIRLPHGPVGQENQSASGSAGYIVPVGLLRAWETGDLQREIKRYAPQLFA
jgi:hypothetical protein